MKRKKSFFLWLFLLIVLTTYNFDSKENLISSFFKIKKIEIEGIQNSDRKEIEEKFNPLKEKNIIFTNQKQFRKLIDNLTLVNEIKVKKIYPDKIKITIKEFKIIGIFVDEKNQEEYILTDHGKIINNYNKKQFNDLPLVFGENADNTMESLFGDTADSILNLNIDKIQAFLQNSAEKIHMDVDKMKQLDDILNILSKYEMFDNILRYKNIIFEKNV